MLITVIYCLLFCFVLLGVISGAYLLMMLFQGRKAKGRFIVVIPSRAGEADVASLLCAARLRLGLMGDIARSEVIALDCGMAGPVRGQCEALCRELDRTRLVRPEELLTELAMNNEQ